MDGFKVFVRLGQDKASKSFFQSVKDISAWSKPTNPSNQLK